MRKKLLTVFLVVESVYPSSWTSGPSMPVDNQTTTQNSSILYPNGQYANLSASSQYAFQTTDWQYLLLPVFETYANSGLTCWWNLQTDTRNGSSQKINKPTLYDYEVNSLMNFVSNSEMGNRQDIINPPYFSVTGYEVASKVFLQNQSNFTGGVEWDVSNDIETMQGFIQSGFANAVAQYGAAFIENFAARAAIGASFFQSSGPNAVVTQNNGGLLGYTGTSSDLVMAPYSLEFSQTGQTYNEQTIVNAFMQTAQTLFQRARYARSMYQFPQNLTQSLASYTTGSPVYAQPKTLRNNQNSSETPSPAALFTLPTNSLDLNTMTSNAQMGPSYQAVQNGNQVSSQPLGPVSTFCGVIVINELGTDIAQQVQGQSVGACQHAIGQVIGRAIEGYQPTIPYAPTYFLPAVIPTYSSLSAYQPLPYGSYASVDQDSNYTGQGAEPVTRVVTFNTNAGITINGTYDTGNILSIVVSDLSISQLYPGSFTSIYNANPDLGIFGQDPVGITLKMTSGSTTTANPVNFSTNASNAQDFQNFFAYPTQWALVLKITSKSLSVLGLVKLNPYDFPLNFTTSSMQSFLGLSSSTASTQTFGNQNAGGMGSSSGASSDASQVSFSQRDVWDGVADLYAQVFPKNYNTDWKVIPSIQNGSHPVIGNTYPFSYLLLQGLMNGYLLSNTFNPIFNMTNWPNLESVDALYNDYYQPNGSPAFAYANCSSLLLLDQVFPTPLASDWLGNNSPLDWLYLRGLVAMRSVLQSMYCPYDALVVPFKELHEHENLAYFNTATGKPELLPASEAIGNYSCLLEYMFAYPTQTIIARIYEKYDDRVYPKSRTIYGQSYVSASANQSGSPLPNATSYQYILPFEGQIIQNVSSAVN